MSKIKFFLNQILLVSIVLSGTFLRGPTDFAGNKVPYQRDSDGNKLDPSTGKILNPQPVGDGIDDATPLAAPSSSPNTPAASSSSDNFNKGEIAGISLAAVAGAAGLVGAGIGIANRSKNKQQKIRDVGDEDLSEIPFKASSPRKLKDAVDPDDVALAHVQKIKDSQDPADDSAVPSGTKRKIRDQEDPVAEDADATSDDSPDDATPPKDPTEETELALAAKKHALAKAAHAQTLQDIKDHDAKVEDLQLKLARNLAVARTKPGLLNSVTIEQVARASRKIAETREALKEKDLARVDLVVAKEEAESQVAQAQQEKNKVARTAPIRENIARVEAVIALQEKWIAAREQNGGDDAKIEKLIKGHRAQVEKLNIELEKHQAALNAAQAEPESFAQRARNASEAARRGTASALQSSGRALGSARTSIRERLSNIPRPNISMPSLPRMPRPQLPARLRSLASDFSRRFTRGSSEPLVPTVGARAGRLISVGPQELPKQGNGEEKAVLPRFFALPSAQAENGHSKDHPISPPPVAAVAPTPPAARNLPSTSVPAAAAASGPSVSQGPGQAAAAGSASATHSPDSRVGLWNKLKQVLARRSKRFNVLDVSPARSDGAFSAQIPLASPSAQNQPWGVPIDKPFAGPPPPNGSPTGAAAATAASSLTLVSISAPVPVAGVASVQPSTPTPVSVLPPVQPPASTKVSFLDRFKRVFKRQEKRVSPSQFSEVQLSPVAASSPTPASVASPSAAAARPSSPTASGSVGHINVPVGRGTGYPGSSTPSPAAASVPGAPSTSRRSSSSLDTSSGSGLGPLVPTGNLAGAQARPLSLQNSHSMRSSGVSLSSAARVPAAGVPSSGALAAPSRAVSLAIQRNSAANGLGRPLSQGGKRAERSRVAGRAMPDEPAGLAARVSYAASSRSAQGRLPPPRAEVIASPAPDTRNKLQRFMGRIFRQNRGYRR